MSIKNTHAIPVTTDAASKVGGPFNVLTLNDFLALVRTQIPQGWSKEWCVPGMVRIESGIGLCQISNKISVSYTAVDLYREIMRSRGENGRYALAILRYFQSRVTLAGHHFLCGFMTFQSMNTDKEKIVVRF